MLKDLFFYIWYDEMGSGWLLLTIILFLFSMSFLIYKLARIKSTNSQFCKKHFICLGIIITICYQIIPVSIDFIANAISVSNINKAIKFEKVAIKTSMIPWQKGGYYCKLANLYLLNKDYNEMYNTYDTAYKYLKSYKCPCWGISYLSFYTKGDYDTAIEIAKNWRVGNAPFQFIANCYLMKNDIQNAELYINKAIQQREFYLNYAAKAYILKITGKKSESITYYKKAIDLCRNEKEKNRVKRTYENFVENENIRLALLRKQQGLK
ncbi:hypothetical protein J6R97_00740 [bacterium]|nr:hypothetical protein [bacterium]